MSCWLAICRLDPKGTRDVVVDMPKIDACEQEVLTAFEKGILKSVATKADLAKQ